MATLAVRGSTLRRRSRQLRRKVGHLRERARPLLLLEGELHWCVSGARVRARLRQSAALEAAKCEPMATVAVSGSTLSRRSHQSRRKVDPFVSERVRCFSWLESCVFMSLSLKYARDRAKRWP